MMEHESPVHVNVTKDTPVHVYVRKSPGREKARSKLRSKSPTKNKSESPVRRPWVPAPAKTSLRDKKGDLKWDDGTTEVCVAERDISPKRSKKSKSTGNTSQSKMDDTLLAYESNISNILEEVEILKKQLGENTKKLEEQQILNLSLSEEIVKKAELTREEDEYSEIASVKAPEDVPIPSAETAQKEIFEEPPVVTKMYPDNLECDRNTLQKLLIQAELDMQTLNFRDHTEVEKFMNLSRDIRIKLASLKRQNFDVSRLEDQRDAVIDKLAQTDSEVAMVKEALYGRESDFKNLKIDTELEREKVVRLTDKVNHLEDIKARIQRELYSREGELNRSQARERVTKKHLLDIQAELDAERAMNGKAKLDMEKQALKRACRHHKTKAESLKLQNEEIILDLNRTQNELEAWRERTRRNHDEVDENIATLKQSERDFQNELTREKEEFEKTIEQNRTVFENELEKEREEIQYKQQKIVSQTHELEEKDEMINRQAREMGTLKVALADAKAHVIEVQASKHRDIENAREDALGSMQALKDLPQELRQAHTRLDEALGEIRSLEERNADLEFQLNRSKNALAMSQQNESELQIYNNKLSSAEIRLDELQRALDETSEDLEKQRTETNNWRLRADERQHTISALERQIEATIVEQRRAILTDQEKYNIKERSLQNKLSDLELELTRSKGELSAIKRQKEDADRRLELQANDLRDRLDHSEATNRSMQSYVNFLKSSYQSTFGDDLVEA